MKRNQFIYRIKPHKVLILLMIMLNTISAQGMNVPANVQAALFKKIFLFDKTLSSKGSVEVAVIGAGSDEIVSAFIAAGLNAKAADQISGSTSVVYLMPGTASLKAQTAAKKILSVSGLTSFVENGTVAIGLALESGKPKIIIHMGQLKAEGQELSSDLLQLAKVIQ